MPGEIISERRATSNRNGGRHHRGFAGDFPRNPQFHRLFRIKDAGSGDRWLPGADEPTIGITMPMTDKPVRRDRYPVKCEQKNEVVRVRRDDTRRVGRAYISVCGSHSLRLPLHRSVVPTRRRECRRALRSRVSPEIRGSPARHCDTLASRRQSVVTASFCRVQQPQKSLADRARSRFASPIPRGQPAHPSPLVGAATPTPRPPISRSLPFRVGDCRFRPLSS
jgi:hypothetical protein